MTAVSGMDGRRNIILIVADAVRRRNLGLYGYDKPTSPNLDSLGKVGVVFDNAYSVTNATDPSLTSIFSGRYPMSHGIVNHGERIRDEEVLLVSKVPYLSSILHGYGYSTIAIDMLGRWHKKGFDIYTDSTYIQRLGRRLKGYINFVSRRFFGKSLFRVWPYNARDAVNLAIHLIKEYSRRGGFFLFIHFWDTHLPYNYSRAYYEKHVDSYDFSHVTLGEAIKDVCGVWSSRLTNYLDTKLKIGEILAMYDASIANIDAEVGRLVGFLEDTGLVDDTYIFFTSDHGESLTEHNIFFDHHGLYEVSLQVPLIVMGPDIPRGRVIDDFVQHVDILPTILSLAGVDVDVYHEGANLLDLIYGEEGSGYGHTVVYAEESYTERKFMIRDGRYKYIFSPDTSSAECRYCGYIHGGLEELYDLNADPGEERNIVDDYPDIARDLRRQLDGLLRRYRFVNRLLLLKSRLKRRG